MKQFLIIDDDPATHVLINRFLSDNHTECVSAYDGAEGLRKACDLTPDVILLDMDLPHIDGDEVCRRLKANPATSQVPVIFLSADRTTHSKVAGLEVGAEDYITKPFAPAELRVRIESVLKVWHARQAASVRTAVDDLTGLWNRTYLERHIQADIAAARRSGLHVACHFATIDRFGELARGMGQPSGADLLRDAALVIAGAVRRDDVVARYDSRTFAVLGLVPDRRAALDAAENIRSAVMPIGLTYFMEPQLITCSIGVVVSKSGDCNHIFTEARRALAAAQHDGNEVVCLSGPGVEAASNVRPN